MRMNAVDYIALALIIIGGLNWGLVGAFEYNLVDSLFGEGSAVARVVYVLVGLAAVYYLIALFVKRADTATTSAR